MPLLDELLVGLGFEYNPKEAKQFKDDLNNTVKSIKELTRIAVAGAVALTGLAISSTHASDEQGKLADEIGETTENIDALQFALRRSGGSADGMSSSLKQLSKLAGETARGVGSGIEAFGLLGISVHTANGGLKSSSDLMLEISQRFKGLSKSQQIDLADKLGVSDSLRLLQQGPDAIRVLTDEARALGVTTGEDAAIAEEFQESLTDLWQIMKQVARTISKTLAPILTSMVTSFSDWWKINKALIEQKLPEWIDKFTMGMKLLTIAVGGFIAFRLVGHIAALITLFKGLTVATLAANAAAFLLPALIAAAAVAFVALVEDAKVFFEGGESFIGDMIKQFPEWATEIEVVAAALNSVAILTTTIFDGWKGIFDLFSTGDFFETLKGITSDAFILDALGLVNVGGGGLIPELGQSVSNATSTFVDKVEIAVTTLPGMTGQVARELFGLFQQTSQDLESTVDQ